MPKKLALITVDADLEILAQQVAKDFDALERDLKIRSARGMWKIGKRIHVQWIKYQQGPKKGAKFFEKLAELTGRDATTLNRAHHFFQLYPNLAARQDLPWGMYKNLITIENATERKALEVQIVQKKLSTRGVQKYLNTKRALAVPKINGKSIPQLTFTRGRLYKYQIIEWISPKTKKTSLRLDLGFKMRRPFTEEFKKAECVEVVGVNAACTLARAEVKDFELFTYKAEVVKVIDADTLDVDLDTGLKHFIEQKLRLRGINCPERGTKDGMRAKRFVERCLKGCPVIIVKTYKDRSDKFDRYLADIFYLPGEFDPFVIAEKGIYLNQELLNRGLAVKYGV